MSICPKIIDEIFQTVRKQRVVLWAGAGFSYGAGLPEARALADILKERHLPACQETDLGRVCDAILWSSDDKSAMRQKIVGTLQEVLATDTISPLHQKTFFIPYFKEIVTTNYDPLFENAYGDWIHLIYNQESLANRQTRQGMTNLF